MLSWDHIRRWILPLRLLLFFQNIRDLITALVHLEFVTLELLHLSVLHRFAFKYDESQQSFKNVTLSSSMLISSWFPCILKFIIREHICSLYISCVCYDQNSYKDVELNYVLTISPLLMMTKTCIFWKIT